MVPRYEGKVRIYNCGPTVYKRQHLGNMRRFLFSDFLRRSLEFLGYEVRDITNITDVGHLTQDDIDAGQDKLEQAAQEQKTTPQQIATKQTELFLADLAALNIKPAHAYPRASAHISQIQQLIKALLKQGHAYATTSGVYFAVSSWPSYGRLSGNKIADIAAGKRIEVRPEKKHPADFALWVKDSQHLQKWDSPWGIGYPGWHIECSAMSLEYLGSGIDIHTGGEDNLFPHHENEIAQSEGATGERFVNIWMHNRHLQMAGHKLAKRAGEQITLDTIRQQGNSPLAFRLLVFGSHYRQPLEFSWQALAAAAANLSGLKQMLRQLPAADPSNTSLADEKILVEFAAALADDLNTPRALAVFANYQKAINNTLATPLTADQAAEINATLHTLDGVLGLVEPLQQEISAEDIPAAVTSLASQREAARRTADFSQADRFRQEIEAQGYYVEDTPSGPRLIKKM